MSRSRPYALSIAGYDPSGGAGLLADIKTFESLKVYGLGVCTANTIQTDQYFEALNWIDKDVLMRQTEVLIDRFPIKAVKIGLMKDMETLRALRSIIQQRLPGVPIILDPILKASVGYEFHSENLRTEWIEEMQFLDLITPNREEMQRFFPEVDSMKAAEKMSQHVAILLKGGHADTKLGYDYLWQKGTCYPYRPKGKAFFPKHGSGCVLSAAITARLAHGEPLTRACLVAKSYISRFLASNKELLGYHKV